MTKSFKNAISILAILLGAAWASAENWQELKGDHFLVYFTQDAKFSQQVLDKAEVYYRNIATDLGYPRYSDFWLWDKRVKIYIYLDHDSYIKATGQPQWSYGVADYKDKSISSFFLSSGFLDSLLPHEIAHLIFRDFVGFKSEIPLWLDEGVAQWSEDAKRPQMKAMVKKLYDEDSLITLEDMMKLDLRYIKEKERIYIRPTRTKTGEKAVVLLSGENLINNYYLQSVSLVGFLIEKYGSDRFADFCRGLRDGKPIEQALRSAYPTYVRSLDELEDRWRAYLKGSN